MKVLVTDGRSLAALAAIRSIGRLGHTVHCGESFRRNLSTFSKYVDTSVTYPDPSENETGFVNALLSAAEREQYDVILPVRDDSTLLISKYRDEFSNLTNVFVAAHETVSTLMDKGETIKLARAAGVPTPKTWFPEEVQIEIVRQEVDYPVLIRPRRSSGSRGIEYAPNATAFDERYATVSSEYGRPMIQEFVDKSGYSTACLLFDEDNQSVGEFTYERVKEYPTSGGPTVVGRSTDDREAKRLARKLLKEASWVGPAEVEFIRDENNDLRLLEVNPRFWMPIQLAISAGVDFPKLIIDLIAGRDFVPVTDYQLGLTYRWLLPNELLWMVNDGRSIRDIVEFLRFNPRNECYGSLSVSDPWPVFGTVVQSAKFATDADFRSSIFDRGWSV